MYNSSPFLRSGTFRTVVLIPATCTERIGFPDAAPFMWMVTEAGNVPVAQSGQAFVAANHGYPRTRLLGPMSAI